MLGSDLGIGNMEITEIDKIFIPLVCTYSTVPKRCSGENFLALHFT